MCPAFGAAKIEDFLKEQSPGHFFPLFRGGRWKATLSGRLASHLNSCILRAMKRVLVMWVCLGFGALCAAQTSPATDWAAWKADPARLAFFADHGWNFTADPGMKPLRPDGTLALRPGSAVRPLELGIVPATDRHTVYTSEAGVLTVYSLERLEELYLRAERNRLKQ